MGGSGLRGRQDVREISSGFLVFGLLFCEKSGEGDNVGIDFGILCLYSVGSHVEGWEVEGMERVESLRRNEAEMTRYFNQDLNVVQQLPRVVAE